MKKLLLVLSFIVLFSCSQEEVITKKMSSNTATLTINTDSEFYLTVNYLTKDRWAHDEKIIKDTMMVGPFETTFEVTKEQNFAYFVQLQEKGKTVTARLQFKDHDKTKSYSETSGIMHDVYEFYKQAL